MNTYFRFSILFLSLLCLTSLRAQTVKEYNFKEFVPLNYENSYNSQGGQQILIPEGVNIANVTPDFTYDVAGSYISSPSAPFDLSNATTLANALSVTSKTPTGGSKTVKLVARQIKKAPFHVDGFTLPVPTVANEDPWFKPGLSDGYAHAAMGIGTVNQWRFTTVTSCLVLGIDFIPRQMTFRLYGINTPVPNNDAAEFTIEQSPDGISWQKVKHYVKDKEVLSSGNTSSPLESVDLLNSTRYVKFYYNNRTGVNIVLNHLVITPVSLAPPAVSSFNVASNNRTTVDLTLNPSKDANCYWICRNASAPVSTKEQLLASSSFAVKAETELTTTLAVSTAPDQVIDFILIDEIDQASDVYTSQAFSNNILNINALYTESKSDNNVNLAFSANDNGTVYYTLLDIDQPMISGQEIINNSLGQFEYSQAPGKTNFNITLNNDIRTRLAVVLKTGDEISNTTNTIVKRYDEVDVIRDRYYDLLVGNNIPNVSDPYMKMRFDALVSRVKTARGRVRELVITDDLPQWNLDGESQTPDVAACRDIVSNILLPLSMGYSLQGTETYHNEEVAKEILHTYDYLAKRNFLSGCVLPFAGGGVYLGLTGYFYGSMLVRDLLIASDRIKEVSDMMQWATRWVVDGDKDWSAESVNNYSRADGVRTIFNNRLMYILTLDDSDISREDKMSYLTNTLNTHFQLFSAWNGFLKPDYSGYHHLGIWGNGYITEALHVAAQMSMLINNTSYELNTSSVENIANGLIAYADYSALYDINRGLCGRMPNQLGNIPNHIPAFAYMYHLTTGEIKDKLAVRFSQLYRPEYSAVQSKLIKSVASSISFFGGIGVLDACISLNKEIPTAEVDMKLNRVFPYGALHVHKRKDWSVTIKGYNKYVWDFEINGSENWFGRNQSLGQLAIYATPDNDGIVTAEASGVGYNGYDWNHIPGVTSFNMTNDEILQEAKYFAWSKFSAEDFAGGVTDGENGLYATKFMDIRQAYDYNPRKWVGARLTARKSHFFFDDMILSLASDINNIHPTYTSTHTTLFQNTLSSVSTPTSVNGTVYNALNQNYTQDSSDPVYFTDAVGNGYYLRNGAGLVINRSLQKSRNDRNTADTEGNYATAYINHGKPTQASYEYAVLVRGKDAIADFASNPESRYTVLQQDASAHIVRHHSTDQIGYAIFNSNIDLVSPHIKYVSEPSMIMVTDLSDNVSSFSFCNPELGYYPKNEFPFQVWSVPADKQFAPAKYQPFTVRLNGKWSIVDSHSSVSIDSYDESDNTTTVLINAINGESYTSKLLREDIDNKIENTKGDVSVYVQDNMLYINSTSEKQDVNVFNVLGQTVLSDSTQGEFSVFNLNGLNKGTYIVKVGDNTTLKIKL